ncbi:MAG: nucleotidyltransferase domain-containing protein, partial [Nanoarchaeota archaeon]
MTLINYLKKSKNVRLLFGKSEIEIMKKQLMGLELSPSERTRLSRDIRKKIQVVEELAKYKNEFALKKSQEVNFIINETKEIILEKFKNNVSKIILFGSYAENTQNKNSDIDITIKLSNSKNASRIYAQILGETSKKVDIHLYEKLPLKIRKEIDKKGKIIFEDE